MALQLVDLASHIFNQTIIRWFYLIEFWNNVRYCRVLDIWKSLVSHNLKVLLILLNNLKAFYNFIEIFTNFFDVRCSLVSITDQRLGKSFLRLLRCVWWAGNIYGTLVINLLHLFKALHIITWNHFFIRLNDNSIKRILINVSFALTFTSRFGCAIIVSVNVVVIKVDHSILIYLACVPHRTLHLMFHTIHYIFLVSQNLLARANLFLFLQLNMLLVLSQYFINLIHVLFSHFHCSLLRSEFIVRCSASLTLIAVNTTILILVRSTCWWINCKRSSEVFLLRW